MKAIVKTILVGLVAGTIFYSCGSGKKTDIKCIYFKPFSNYNIDGKEDTLIEINADLTEALRNGLEIPSANQTSNGKFIVKFKVSNSVKSKLYYKLYYQNESYKWPEGDALDYENFYGSWENTDIGFKEIKEADFENEITDSFRIVGNPRNEQLYFGPAEGNFVPTEEQILNKVEEVRANSEWMKDIERKAKENKRSIDEQTRLDAQWAISEIDSKKAVNNRWKRNPRAGKYKIMLVVCTDGDLKKIPEEVKNISKQGKDGKFVNPFTYFTKKEGRKLSNTLAQEASQNLKVIIKHNLASGIYVNTNSLGPDEYNNSLFGKSCGDSDSLYKYAQFQQYFHWVNKDFKVRNVPEFSDIVSDNFTRKQYDDLLKKYEADPSKLVEMFVNITDCPCKTVKYDSVEKCLVLVTPGGSFKKEQVGIRSRVGLSYGKWRAKIKFPTLLSKDNVWMGLTNAFWLLAQEEGEWNNRRDCNAQIAYIPKPEPDNNDALSRSKKNVAYSEIDFEIVKESRFWPKSSYGGIENYPKEDASLNNDVMVCCTNWDLACHEPKNFNIGAKDHKINGQTYTLHRWDHWYKALTAKIPVPNDELFGGDYFYYELDWQPDKIIWRIGKEKDKMRVICVMTNNVSAIPNNQMNAIVTQEWHNQEWWPTAPFKQNFIPFPKKDVIGKILELEVE